MSERITHTIGDDAPLSAARDPDSRAEDLDADASDELVGRTVTINRPREEVYAFWRSPGNLVGVMENIEAITIIDDQRSHWIVKGPGGKSVEWDSIIVEDVPNTLLRWQSDVGADISHSGHVEFRDAPGGRGTTVTATIVYDPPAGGLGKVVAKLFQREPKIQSRRDLRRLKQFLETGEIATSRINVDPIQEDATSH